VNSLRQVEKLSNQHWTMVYLAETPHWQGEAVIVETGDNHCTALIPDINLETRVHCRHILPLNTFIQVVLAEANVPELRAFFRINE